MSQYSHPETLVDTQWLSEHLHDPQIRIIEMGLNSQLYDEGHIPGAIFWRFTAPLLPDFRTNFNVTAIEQLLGSLSISNDTVIVLVHRETPSSGWIFWLLKVFRHPDVRILNGGVQKWLEDGYFLTTKKEVVTPTKYGPREGNRPISSASAITAPPTASPAPIRSSRRTKPEATAPTGRNTVKSPATPPGT